MIEHLGFGLLVLLATGGVLYFCLFLPDMRDAVIDRLRWVSMLHEIIRTDRRMLTDAFRLSAAHFQALNELRKLGDRR